MYHICAQVIHNSTRYPHFFAPTQPHYVYNLYICVMLLFSVCYDTAHIQRKNNSSIGGRTMYFLFAVAGIGIIGLLPFLFLMAVDFTLMLLPKAHISLDEPINNPIITLMGKIGFYSIALSGVVALFVI